MALASVELKPRFGAELTIGRNALLSSELIVSDIWVTGDQQHSFASSPKSLRLGALKKEG